jgi:hypothetical protein
LASWANLSSVLHKSLLSVCVSVCGSLLSLLGKGLVKCFSPVIARQRPGKHVPAATNTRNNKRIAGRVCLWVCLCIPLSLLGNNSVKMFLQQWRIVGGIVLYVARVESKESRNWLLPELLAVISSVACMVQIICLLYDTGILHIV